MEDWVWKIGNGDRVCEAARWGMLALGMGDGRWDWKMNGLRVKPLACRMEDGLGEASIYGEDGTWGMGHGGWRIEDRGSRMEDRGWMEDREW